MNTLKIEIYSDLICPWCYIGKRRMEAGLKLLGTELTPKIVWRPFRTLLRRHSSKLGLRDRSNIDS
jgi:predicted DsbA family dithiol-disulfide isomerase